MRKLRTLRTSKKTFNFEKKIISEKKLVKLKNYDEILARQLHDNGVIKINIQKKKNKYDFIYELLKTDQITITKRIID